MKKLFVIQMLALFVVVCGVVFYWYQQPETPEVQLIKQLDSVTEQFEKIGLTGRQAGVITLSNAQLIIMSDAQGELKLIRLFLDHLKELNLLSDDLVLRDSAYLIFNGNMIDEQLYGLSLLLDLIKKNPKKLFYLRGPNEERVIEVSLNNWYYERSLQRFFARLMSGIYLFVHDTNVLPVRIVPTHLDTTSFESLACRPVDQSPITALCDLQPLCSVKQGNVFTLTYSKPYVYKIIQLGSSFETSSVAFYGPSYDMSLFDLLERIPLKKLLVVT